MVCDLKGTVDFASSNLPGKGERWPASVFVLKALEWC